MTITDIIAFAKSNNRPITAVKCTPKYDEKKGRVTKGDTLVHQGWKDKGRYEPKNTKTTPFTDGCKANMWMLNIEKTGLYVVDIDPKNGKSAKEVIKPELWDGLYEKCEYIVETGSKGLHLYFRMPELEEGTKLKKKVIKAPNFSDLFVNPNDADVDIIADCILTEGSSYDYDNVKYQYVPIKPNSNINNVSVSSDFWEQFIQPILVELPQNQINQNEIKHRLLDVNELKEHLDNIPNNKVNWDDWYKMAQNIFNIIGFDGFDVFRDWSAKNPIHNEGFAFKLWRGLTYRPDGSKRTIGTVLYLSKQADEVQYNKIRSKYNTVYDLLKFDFEEKHFYFEPTNTIVKVNEEGMFHYTLEHSNEAFNHLIVPAEDGKNMLFITKWRKDPKRRRVQKFVYKMPNECLDNEYSLFTGFDYKRISIDVSEDERKINIELFNNIVSAICNDEVEISEYIMNGFAHMIQKPFEKTGVLIAFSSETEGTGKDTAMLILKRIIGNRHTAHYTSTVQYWDKHDTKQEGAIFVYLEEACSKLNTEKEGQLKARVTADCLTVNDKGKKPYDIPNIGRQYMTTNEVEPFKISQSDRRGLLINPSNRLVKKNKDDTFWANTYAKIFTPGFLKSIGEYLETIDISNWIYKNIPETDIKTELKLLAKSSEQQFFDTWEAKEWVSSGELYNDYKNYCTSESLPFCQNTVSFTKKIVKYKGKMYQMKRGGGNKAFYAPMNYVE
jgi:hypothetical protein